MTNLDGKKTWPIFIIIIIIVLGITGYYAYRFVVDYPIDNKAIVSKTITKPTATVTPTYTTSSPTPTVTSTTSTPTTTPTVCLKDFSNPENGISFKYNCDWTVETLDSMPGGKGLNLRIYQNLSEKNENHITICVGACGHGLETYEKTDSKTILANTINWEIGYFEGYDNMEEPRNKTGVLAIITTHYIGDNGYAIEAYYNKTKDDIFRKEFNQILNSFQISN